MTDLLYWIPLDCTTQAADTTGVLPMRAQSKALPPGTVHFLKLSHCVFPLTALFALWLCPKHKSEAPVTVITAPLKRNDKWTNVTIPWPAHSLFAQTALHIHTDIRIQKSPSFLVVHKQIMKVLLQEGNRTEQVKAVTYVHTSMWR